MNDMAGNSMLMIAAVVACAGLMGGGDGDGGSRGRCWELLDAPCYTPDARHPRPSWVGTLESMPRSRQAEAFSRLTLRKQIEFAVFAFTDNHPPVLEWASGFRKRPPPRLDVVLQEMISGEPSDRFVEGLLQVVAIATGARWRPSADLVHAMDTRIARVELPQTKDACRALMEEIDRNAKEADAGDPQR